MKRLAALLLAFAVCLPALGQDRQGRDRQLQKQGMQPQERPREARRGRLERRDSERHRFTREERRQLRQDLMDANREMKGRK
jgi:hypothetical protein